MCDQVLLTGSYTDGMVTRQDVTKLALASRAVGKIKRKPMRAKMFGRCGVCSFAHLIMRRDDSGMLE